MVYALPHQVTNSNFRMVFPQNTAIIPFVANASTTLSQNCCDGVKKVASAVGKFFYNRYADVRLFFRGVFSMFGGADTTRINLRVSEINAFRRIVEGCGNNPAPVLARFADLPSVARDVLFVTDHALINRFASTRDPVVIQNLREDIVRDCNRAVSLQRTLQPINSVYRCVAGGSGGSSVRTTPATIPRTVITNPTLPSATTTIVGTLPYNRTAIPAEVRIKGQQIERLFEQFDRLPNASRPAVPGYMEDMITRDIIAIPVFDVSHPAIQEAMRAPAGTPIAARLNQPIHRHALNNVSMDQLLQNHSWGSPARCPSCRHPDRGRINASNLLIDTALQDEILQFLQNAVNSSSTTVVTVPATTVPTGPVLPLPLPQLRQQLKLIINDLRDTIPATVTIPDGFEDIINIMSEPMAERRVGAAGGHVFDRETIINTILGRVNHNLYGYYQPQQACCPNCRQNWNVNYRVNPSHANLRPPGTVNGYGNFGADIIANGGLDAEFTFNDDLQRRIAGWLVTNFHRGAPFTNPQKQAVANWVSGNYRPPASQII